MGVHHDGCAASVAGLPVPLVAPAGNVLALNQLLEGLLGQDTTQLFRAPAGTAGLFHLRGADAVEPDLGVVYVDCVAAHNVGFAGDSSFTRECRARSVPTLFNQNWWTEWWTN